MHQFVLLLYVVLCGGLQSSTIIILLHLHHHLPIHIHIHHNVILLLLSHLPQTTLMALHHSSLSQLTPHYYCCIFAQFHNRATNNANAPFLHYSSSSSDVGDGGVLLQQDDDHDDSSKGFHKDLSILPSQ
ncbi:hypothetical protein RIF29_11354 [Crotalaria pallida]|uniref:Uncharacterized protein n=1 Tax=Crotalaria pallida TaxID=3830 RepID=A0AAN9NZX8_CROPI